MVPESTRFHSLRFILALLLLCLAGPAAATGRTELNQVVIDAAGGFPFSISAPGNYVLTGPLTVPASTDGFVLTTNQVVFDLNGFSISGPATCNTSSCPSGSGMAIRGFSGIAHAHMTTVRNGTIRGFGDNCLRLGRQARVDNLLVTECGRNGISVTGGGVVTNNRVLQVGETGILMSNSATADSYGFNTVATAGLGGGGSKGVLGGKSATGNSCDDASCGRLDLRPRYYLSTTIWRGDTALEACAEGFHMASFWEIRETATLRYDVELGIVRSDSGAGPPLFLSGGWIRTGAEASAVSTPGSGNCDAWTSSSPLDFGTAVSPGFNWGEAGAVHQLVAPWIATSINCSAFEPVWCLED